MHFKDFADLDFSYTDIYFHFRLPCRLPKAYAVLWAANRFVGSETPKRNAFDQLNSILKILQDTHNFLVSMDPIIICI